MARKTGNGRPGRGFYGTEAEARKVKEQIEAARPGRKVKPGTRYLDPTKPTAKQPKGTPTYKEAEAAGKKARREKEKKAYEELMRKRRERMQKKKTTKRKVAKKKVARRKVATKKRARTRYA